jgi:eukaryotic-like serine/threonine-protein kinase
LVPGIVIDDRFELERQAGAGGMGVVFRALDRLEDAPVAVKFLRSENVTEIARFEREASVLAELHHPGIVRYIAHGTTPAGAHYLVMEWLDGEDLRQRFAQRALTLAESLTILRRTATALFAAHARGILHRDIKPSNIFLVSGDIERVKLLDFGIARLARDTQQLTRPGHLIGTLGYMAPEQVQGSSIHDPRTDVFALGCVFFECLANRRAFEGSRAMAVLAKILLQEVPSLRGFRPDVPEPVERLIARMLAKNPDERPRDAAEVAAELERLSSDLEGVSVSSAEHFQWLPGGPASTAPPPSRDPFSLTLREQRLVTVVLGGAPNAEDTTVTREITTPELEHFGGHLNVLADGSMLVTIWGTGSVVDRVERAARCALALRARFSDIPICVVTGRGVAAVRVVEGEVIDRGVRAIGLTRAGAVWIDRATADMLGTRFLIEPDVEGFTLRGERSFREDAARLLGKPTTCVGRGRELLMLENMFLGCMEEPLAGAVLVTGVAGSGKSRLRQEFLEKLQRRGDPVEILSGRANSLGESSPFGLVADAIRHAAGIQEGEPIEARRQKLTHRLGRHLKGAALARVSAFLGELCRVPFPDDDSQALQAARTNAQLMGDAMRAAWEDWLTAECAASPMLLVLEDLHWGDAATVRLIDTTLRNLRNQPLLVLVLARPEVHTRFPALWAERQVQMIKLSPLLRKASEQLVRHALGEDARADLIARIVERADGNPFYLEELIRAVAAGRGDAFPDSVLGTVEARLDAEGSEAKRILRAASIFGDRFSTRGVAALLGGEHHLDEASVWLEALAAREIISSATSLELAEDAGYLFRHALVREAAYATLTEADRALGHRLAGAWIESTGSTDALTMAEHFSRGGEPARAVRWFRRAAEQALEADDLPAVLERVERAVACGASGEDLGALRLVEAEARVWRGDLALSEQRSSQAIELLTPGSAPWFRAIRQTVIAAGKQGGTDRVARWAEPARAATAAGDALSARLLCLSECATQLIFGGRYADADALIKALSQDEPDPTAEGPQAAALLHQMRAFHASAAGDPGACLEELKAALAAFEQAGDLRDACVTRSNLGFIYAELGDFEGAEQALRGAEATADRMGLYDVTAATFHNLGRVLAHLGRFDEARRLEEQAMDAYRRQGDPRMEGSARAYLAQIALLASDFRAAERDARAAIEALSATPPLRAGAVAVLSRALLGQGRAGEALIAADEAFALLSSLGSIEEGESLVRLSYAEALAANGKDADFCEAITDAREKLLARAARISDPAWRERFLASVPDNAQTLALAELAAVEGGS